LTPSRRLSRVQVRITRTAVNELSKADWDELVRLYQSVYDVDPETIKKSINNRTTAYRAFERSTGRLVGIAVCGVMRLEVPGHGPATVFNSGDTLMAPEARGLGLMQQAGIWEWLRELAHDPRTTKYVFGLAGTYRMYRTISRMFIDYWPRHDCSIPAPMHTLMDEAGSRAFGDAWRGPEQPVISGRRDHAGVAFEIPPAELDDDAIRFFVQRNPNYLQGDAIPVLMRMDARNFWSLAQTSFGAWRRR
jgi:hypothetical protein